MTLRIGTAHFVSFNAACEYYRNYGFDTYDVTWKLRDGEIHIGPPRLKGNEKLSVVDNGTRYAIEED